MSLDARDRLIVALDVPSVKDAEAMVTRLGDAVCFYKIGYQLAFAGGLPFAARLIAAGKQVFLDLKLHDIGNTVTKGVESVAQMGATFLTVHAYPQTMKAAVEGKQGSKLRILAVTVLTSYDDADLAAAGYELNVSELVARAPRRRATSASTDLSARRKKPPICATSSGPGMVLVTPGIRPAGSAAGDQKRIMTPAKAIAAGADYLVVGRPIVEARRSEGRGGGDRRRNRATGDQIIGRNGMAKGYWIGRVDVRSDEGYKPYAVAQSGDLQEIRRAGSSCAAASSKRRGQRALPQRGDRISRLCHRAGLLQFARIPGQHQGAAAAFDRRYRDYRGLRRPAAADGDSLLLAPRPLYPRHIPGASDGRNAFDCRRCRRADGPHADQGDCREQEVHACRRARRRAFAADRLGCRRAGGPAARTASSWSATPAPVASARPTASSTSPSRRRRSNLPRSRPRPARCTSSAPPALSAADEAKIAEAAKTAVIVKSGNMSLGVNLLAALTKRVAKTLDDDFDIEILEMHHNKKIDAPSGTALMLGRAAAEGRGIDLDKHSVRSRDGHTGARRAGDIGFATLRGGTVVGEHTVIFAGPAERIELTHKAEDRMMFARGALHAGAVGARQKPGLYSMADVLR